MKFKIANKKDFLANVLGPVASLSDKCVINVEPSKLSCLVSASDATLVLYSETQIASELTVPMKLNIPDVRRLMRGLECIDSEELELSIETNHIKYSSPGYKFKFHLLDDNVIKSPAINMKKVDSLVFNTTFKVNEARLTSLFNGASFATETNKLYIYTEGSIVYGELGDKARANVDNFQCAIIDAFTGDQISKPIPINFETFRLIAIGKCPDIEFAINSQLGILKITLNRGGTKLIYIVSALIS